MIWMRHEGRKWKEGGRGESETEGGWEGREGGEGRLEGGRD